MIYSVVSNGQLMPSHAPGEPVPWWSFTKTVLAAGALTLVRDGLLGLDDTLPEGPFTLRQLLRHEAGLADYGELADYHTAVASHQQAWPAIEMLQRLEATRLRYSPGDGWRYSNVGYLYLARLIERLCGLTLEQALVERVLEPLGISQVYLATAAADIDGVYDPRWVYHGLLMGPLAQAALLLDRLLAGQLIPMALVQAMQTVRPLGGPLPGRPWQTAGYGLGLMQGTVAGGLTLSGHTGVGPGSVVAVYRCVVGSGSASCAVFLPNGSEGGVEAQVLTHLLQAL
ncbi:MAG: serine hydrolase [Pseudomonas sp.]|nr:serine hydrolase [Pseudomonas sp.]